jgi:hypothetical protein
MAAQSYAEDGGQHRHCATQHSSMRRLSAAQRKMHAQSHPQCELPAAVLQVAACASLP